MIPLLFGVNILSSSASRLLQKKVLSEGKLEPISFAIVFQFLAGATLALIAGRSMLDINLGPYIGNFILSVFFFVFGNVLLFKALQIEHASIVTITHSTNTIWTTLTAVVLLGEDINSYRMLGILLMIVAVNLAAYKGKNFRFSKGAVYSLISAAFFGLAFTNDSYILQANEPIVYFSYSFLATSLVTSIIYIKKTPNILQIFSSSPKIKFQILMISVLYAISIVALFTTLAYGVPTYAAATIHSTNNILTVILAIVILNEKGFYFHKISAAILSVFGVLLLY